MSEQRRTGHLWAIVQQWLDAMPYPPSQRKLAARLDVSPSIVTDWKYGDGLPMPEHLRRLAEEVGVPYERVLNAALIDRGYRTPEAPNKQGREPSRKQGRSAG